VISQTQLQSQVITLQGTVIRILQDALFTGRINEGDMARLYNASEFAREGTVRALRDQYQRMLQAAPLKRPIGPIRRISSTPSLATERSTTTTTTTGTEVARRRDSKALALWNRPGTLFCRYAEMLQDTSRPLARSFQLDSGDARADGRCPACGVAIPIEPGRSWKIDKELVHEKVLARRPTENLEEVYTRVEDRKYMVSNRFVVKCHREGAGYACYLCYRNRDADTLCESMEGLVQHVSKDHQAAEYDAERDIKEVIY